jgi:hypothetical protein
MLARKRTLLTILVATAFFGGCKKDAIPSVQAQTFAQTDPPAIDAGIGVEQAYAAIPHRRTAWSADTSSVPSADKAYLRDIFQVLDEGVAIRVASQQNYAAGHVEYADPVGQYGELLSYVRSMNVPPDLVTYHQHIIEALEGQQQYFADWRAQGDAFPYVQRIAEHPGVQKSSAHLRAAYNELMAKFPNEAASNKDAFFDYHCALDFM